MITDAQVYTALLIALVASILALNLGKTIYQ
jgi:photosystem I reaction center subunit XII|uniref:Photosystem I reaction center subunit XII n=1 Tax=Acanthoceras zachariasii TaxID=451788 RepID=A0A2U9NTQ0_9STRA|nr:photosystem I protein M [Acanthoceras zachariasii]AWT40468.1 photosystem I protein M [Acanthoceras zachariasii]